MIAGVRLARRLEVDPRRQNITRLLGAAAGLLLAGLLLLLTGRSPFTILSDSIEAIWSKRGVENVLRQAVPIVMCALGVALSLRMRVWNIGSDGQFLFGAFCALGISINVDAPDPVLLVLMAVAGALGGALWILVPALARAYWGVNEIITTLLLNFVALELIKWASLGFWRDTKSQVTKSTVLVEATLPRMWGFERLSIAVLVPVVITIVLFLVFRATTVGYEIDMIGGNARAARFAGVNVPRRIVTVMLITGSIAGLAGMLQLTGVPGSQALGEGFSSNFGLSGFIVAALAGAAFAGVPIAGLFIAAMFYAGLVLQTKGLSVYIVLAIYAVVLIGVAIGEVAARYDLVRPRPHHVDGPPSAPAALTPTGPTP